MRVMSQLAKKIAFVRKFTMALACHDLLIRFYNPVFLKHRLVQHKASCMVQVTKSNQSLLTVNVYSGMDHQNKRLHK